MSGLPAGCESMIRAIAASKPSPDSPSVASSSRTSGKSRSTSVTTRRRGADQQPGYAATRVVRHPARLLYNCKHVVRLCPEV